MRVSLFLLLLGLLLGLNMPPGCDTAHVTQVPGTQADAYCGGYLTETKGCTEEIPPRWAEHRRSITPFT